MTPRTPGSGPASSAPTANQTATGEAASSSPKPVTAATITATACPWATTPVVSPSRPGTAGDTPTPEKDHGPKQRGGRRAKPKKFQDIGVQTTLTLDPNKDTEQVLEEWMARQGIFQKFGARTLRLIADQLDEAVTEMSVVNRAANELPHSNV